MRHAKLVPAVMAMGMLFLSGCTLSVYNSYRDIENLDVVQVIGLDAVDGGGVRFSVATGPDSSGREPVRLTQDSPSLDGAMRSMEQLSGPGSLFYSGTGAIVMGEKAADDAERWLDAVARSKELRLDTELYVLKHGQAEELIAGDDAPEDVFADLSSLAKLVREDGPSPVPTCADVSRALLSSGSSLATAIELTEGADGKLTPVTSGYAILTGSGLAGWLSEEEALGAGLFMGGPGISVVELEDGITAELAGADVALDARWGKDGGIEGIDVSAEVKGSVIEAPAGSSLGSEEAWAELEQELAGCVYGWVSGVLEKSQTLNADFLNLEHRIESAHPLKYANMPVQWSEAFRDIDISVSVQAKIVNMREYSVSPYEGES